ncbi:MAG: alpha-amylase family protein [Kineosporiaceae bacterium]
MSRSPAPTPVRPSPIPWDATAARWYRHAVVYCVDVDTFADSDGDGVGDLPGLTARLGHLGRLGVTCLWLNPIHPTPNRDDGYDVSDYYGVDPRLGTLGDFVELVRQAEEQGIRVIMDLVVNHTSDEHPWFVSARSDPASPYRDWYVWSEQEPADRFQGMVFPGEQHETWTLDDQAGAWFYHRFYRFQPDLNWRNPAVRAEIRKVMGFWLQLGVAGFRVDAAPFVIELVTPGPQPDEQDFAILDEWRQFCQWRRADAVLLGEANVKAEDVARYYGSSTVAADRMHLLFDFVSNPKLFLALARGDADPLVEAISGAVTLPDGAQRATFLRNHDELDLSRLSAEQREDVFAAFAPEEDMRLYGRGIRRRLATMLGDDQRRLELAYALQFSLPGTAVLRYGEEIGMGEDLSLKGRDAFRTPMQWDRSPNAGFSIADAEALVRPVVADGAHGPDAVNVADQRRREDSLLAFMERLIRVRRDCPEIGEGVASLASGEGIGLCVGGVPLGDGVTLPRGVLAHRIEAAGGVLLFVHNLTGDEQPVTLDLGDAPGDVEVLLTDAASRQAAAGSGRSRRPADPAHEPLPPYGFRWVRLERRP